MDLSKLGCGAMVESFEHRNESSCALKRRKNYWLSESQSVCQGLCSLKTETRTIHPVNYSYNRSQQEALFLNFIW